MKSITYFLAASLLFCLPPAHAERLDDSLSPRQRVEATPKWLNTGDNDWTDEQINAMVAEINSMEFRLKTQPYQGKTARVFLTVSRLVKGLRSPVAMRVEWTTRGKFLPGSILPGDKALVFQGKITEAVMSDFFDFKIFIDGRYLDRGLEFDPVFEIEVEK